MPGNAKERWTLKKDQKPTKNGPQLIHPNQLPQKYMERLVKAFTQKDDWVFDTFAGTATLPLVAKVLDRNSISCELTTLGCRSARNRISHGFVLPEILK